MLGSGSKLYRDDPDAHERGKYRTECWLERCIFEERICPPDEHISFAPVPVQTPVDGAFTGSYDGIVFLMTWAGTERISLSFSGLDQSEACWIRRLARALGRSPFLP